MTETGAPTVRGLLDAKLRDPRVRSLETEVTRVADRPLRDTVADLRTTLSEPITSEDCRRLHVLISTLYHRAGADLTLTEELRAAIETARAAPAKEGR